MSPVSCWLLLQVGASLRSPMAMRGRRAADSTTTSTTTSTNTSTSVDFAVVGGWLPAAVAEGDSRKNNSTKNKLLESAVAAAPAAVGVPFSSCNVTKIGFLRHRFCSILFH